MQQVLDDINGIETSTNVWEGRNVADKYEKTFLKIANEFSDDEKAHIDDVLVACVRTGDSNLLEHVGERILESRKFIDWKKRPDVVERVFDAVRESACKSDAHSSQRHYIKFMGKFIELLSSNQIFSQHANKVFEITCTAFNHVDDRKLPIHNAALSCITKYPWKDYPDHMVQMVKFLQKTVKHNPDLPDGSFLHSNCEIAMPMMFRIGGKAVVKINGVATDSNEKSRVTSIHMAVLSDIAEIFNFCADQEWQSQEEPGKKNICYTMLQSIMEDFLNNGQTKPELVKPMIKAVKELWQCGDATLQRDANYIMTAMAGETELMGDQTDALLEKFLNAQDMQIAAKLIGIYGEQPDKIHSLLPRFVEMLSQDDDFVHVQIIQLFTQIAKSNPQRITAEAIRVIERKLASKGETGFMYQVQALMFLDALAVHRPADIISYENDLIQAYSIERLMPLVGNILVKLAKSEEQQRKYLAVFASRVSTPGMYQIAVMSNMRQVGLSCPKILGEHRALIEKLRSEPTLQDMSQAMLDVIDGRTLETVTQEIGSQRKDINQLDTRMGATEGDVRNIKTDVKENQQNITAVKTDVANQGQKLDDLKVVVDETVEKVVEIDHKTLSHAPSWSRDITVLLNPTADHDWRLLASRLGYTPEDIRNWGTQPDPCLSMLDEWFATHKTREATYGVLKTLVEMDRTDAAVIVEKALKAVEHLVEEDDQEPAEPPPIFLSYQWAHQPEVKLLRRHLDSAGYSSWMDVGQMGGGDKLFAKIDKGIRAAKVIICCVTEKYAESPNCNREVNLAVALGKPIIPLLVEKMSWPPPGAMGPIFGEYIFVRFFQRDDEKTSDDRYWAPDKFSELLMQLRYHIAPTVAAIPADSMYKNWWQPPPEVITIKPRNNAFSGLTPVEKTEEVAKTNSPELFISYQWDKQPEIKALYRRLTELGFTCWLDIMQMGGGDSLFDKIDRGVRGCKLVLSCVTPKYAKSLNCRREVSLADALKKPIIPLLLEDMSWPPEGPMGMVLTQLLYISFYKPTNAQIQKDWTGPEFEELLRKINTYLPSMPRVTAVQSTPVW